MQKPQYLGYGLGLRSAHFDDILATQPKNIDWFEIVTENFLVPGGNPLYYLNRIRENYPLVMHGVSLSIGSSDPLDWDYLQQIKQLADHIKPAWISDHLCWTGVNGLNLHDLLPLPYTEEALKHVVTRLSEVQDFLGQRILLENPSSYISYKESEMTEWEFLTQVAKQADCLILLDINNIYVSAFNHRFDPQDYLAGIPVDRVQQFHVAGYTHKKTHIIDTHSASVTDPVWTLYADAIHRFNRVSTLLERDDNIPALQELIDELMHAKSIAEQAKNEITA